MKILYHHRTRSKDGQYVHIEELTRALRGLGHEVRIVGPPQNETEPFGADAGLIAVLKRRFPLALYEAMELAYAWVAYRRLERAYRDFRPDCLYERYNLFTPSGLWLHRKHRLPMLLEVNGPLVDERSRFGGLALKRLARWSERAVWCGADYVLPVTRVLAGHVRSAGVPEERIVVIPNGIDRDRFERAPSRPEAKRRLGLEDRLVLGFTGFVREWHGLERVIDFVAEGDPALGLHLLAVGDGPAKASLAAHASRLGVGDRVVFTGVVDRDRIRDYIAAFDVALQPAVRPYASPLKLFEYMVMGHAIVAPATPNLREILTGGEDALLFDPGSDASFRDALERLCADPDLRRRLGAAARRSIDEQGLTWADNARRVEALFHRLGVGEAADGAGALTPRDRREPPPGRAPA